MHGDQNERAFLADRHNNSDKPACNSTLDLAPPITAFVLGRALIDRSTFQCLDYLPHCELPDIKFDLEIRIPIKATFTGETMDHLFGDGPR